MSILQFDHQQLAHIVNAPIPKAQFVADGVSIDTRSIKPKDLYIAIMGENLDGHQFIAQAREAGASAALVSCLQDDPLPQIVVKDTVQALGDIAKWWRLKHSVLVVAVTGSNGKTTVKEMLRHIFAIKGEVLATTGNFNNHIGLPLTLLRLTHQHQYVVLEMGANHRNEIAYLVSLAQPDITLVNNVGPAHLEGFGSIEGVAKAKSEIYQFLSKQGIAIINADDQFANFMRSVVAKTPAKIISFGLSNPADITVEGDIVQSQFQLQTPSDCINIQLPLLGKHNVMNALAASAVGFAANLTLEQIKQGLENMKMVAGRLQIKQSPDMSINIIDDTYNANLASLTVALNVLSTMPGEKWVILGDMGELGEYSQQTHTDAGLMIKKQSVNRFYALGELCEYAVRSFGEGGEHFHSQQMLINSLKSAVTAGITILVKGSRKMQMEHIVSALMEPTS